MAHYKAFTNEGMRTVAAPKNAQVMRLTYSEHRMCVLGVQHRKDTWVPGAALSVGITGQEEFYYCWDDISLRLLVAILPSQRAPLESPQHTGR